MIAGLLLCVLPDSINTARADITHISTTPTPVPVAQSAAPVKIVWNVSRRETVGPAPRNVSSTSLTLEVNGETVATLAGAISKTAPAIAPGQTQLVSLPETITLSAAQIDLIAAAPPGRAYLVRQFTDTQRVLLHRAPVTATALGVRRLDLSFSTDSRAEVVKEGDILRAVAEISFTNSGLLRGEWRLVEPAGSLGGGAGRVLRVVREQLISTGQGTRRLTSPPLPTDQNGLYLLSFVVTDTDATYEVPVIRYFVLDKPRDEPPAPLRIFSPQDKAALATDTVFAWQAIQGAEAYKLEILETDSDMPVAGKLVPGQATSLTLTDMSFDHLTAGHIYDWRIRAFADGAVIGQSERRRLVAP